MNTRRISMIVIGLFFSLVSMSLGQPPGMPGIPPGPAMDAPDRMRPEGFGPPSFALKDALDTDRDGKLSAAEIQAASESLKKLDKNNDGKLDAEEIGWPPRRAGGPRGGPPGLPFGGEPGERSLAERLINRDANGDGQVTNAELPKSMQFLLRLGDIDKNGSLDKNEADRLGQQLDPPLSRPAERSPVGL